MTQITENFKIAGLEVKILDNVIVFGNHVVGISLIHECVANNTASIILIDGTQIPLSKLKEIQAWIKTLTL
jgi:hypothetical protein